MPTTQISDLLDISPRFLRSTQLERDFDDPSTLEGYIVTPEVTEHLQRLSSGLRRNSRAWRITGDFGCGKSSFAVVLANLLSRPSTALPKPIRPLRDDLGLTRNAPKLLPVLVTGSREALSTAILRSTQEAISQNVDGRSKFPARQRIAEILSDGNFSDRDAIAALEQCSTELAERDIFGGIILVIDELGKFLEFASLHPERHDVYFLQQLGEAASRSGDAPLITIGLLHQGFAAYADKLSETAQREWEKVAGRYEDLVFAQPLNQVATLLSSALRFSDSAILRGWKSKARRDMSNAVDLGMFGPAPGKTSLTQLAPELYPLHPTVLPVLAKFFRRFGQNERSLFSFLLSSEPFALRDFSEQEAGPETIYRLADFYDYAAHNFAHRLSNQSFRSHWNHIDAVIRSGTGEEAEDLWILKTIGILNVTESPELAPSQDLLALALGSTSDLLDRLQALAKRSILFDRGRRGYALWPHTSVNLEQAFLKANESVSTAPSIADVVRSRLDTRPIVARRHYIQTGSLRHFAVRFLTTDELREQASQLSPTHPADGMLAVVLCETVAARAEAEQIASELEGSAQVLIVISSPLESLSSFALELERWHWVERHTPELKDDRFAAEEVSRQLTTSAQLLDKRIQDYVGFRGTALSDFGGGIAWYYKGESVTVTALGNGTSLQSFLSLRCEELFQDSPSIPNELVNRHALSAAAASGRQKLFKRMLEGAALPNLGLPEDKAPPEKSMYLSVLQASRIHHQQGDQWRIAFPKSGKKTDPCHVRKTLDEIVRILEAKPDARVKVDQIRNILRQPPFGVRDGLIPIFLLTTLIELETEIAIYEDGVFQPSIEENLMMRLAKRPETFEFQLCRITGVRRELVSQLAAAIKANQAEKTELLTIVRSLCVFVAELPEYVRNTEKLTPSTLALRKAIEAAKEPADLIFNAIPQSLGFNPKSRKTFDASALASQLSRSVTELRRAFPELQGRMSQLILKAFESSDASLEAWRSRIAPLAETVLVGVADADLRAFCLKLHDGILPEGDWLEALGSMLARRPPTLWNDTQEEVFAERIRALAGQFNRVQATCFDQDGNASDTAVRVSLTRRSGIERERVLNLTPEQNKEADKIKEKLQRSLSTDNSSSLAAVSKILWELLEDSE